MEDKEKILSEVDRLTKCYYDEKHGKSHNPLTRARLTGMIEVLEIVHDYIGSMQAENKEPANKVWHDAREEKPLDGSRVLTVQKENCLPSLCFYNKMKDVYGISHTSHNLIVYPSKWAYVEDLLKFGEFSPKLPQISQDRIWHNASDKADEGALYLYRTTQNVVGINRSEGKNFPCYCERWAYIDDIFKHNYPITWIGYEESDDPESEDLGTTTEDKIVEIAEDYTYYGQSDFICKRTMLEKLAQWQKEQLMKKTCEFLYDQLNNGDMECGDIEKFIECYKNKMDQ